jgi:hypothetical protein
MENQKQTSFIADIAIMEMEGEPRARDLDIAERLGFERPRDIRKLIERNVAELQRYGVCATMAQTYGAGTRGGRPTEEFWLNEPQALLIAMRSDAKLAPAVREMLIRVFMAWRQGRSAPAFDEAKIARIAGEAAVAAVNAMLPTMIAEAVASGEFSIGKGFTAGQVVDLAKVPGASGMRGLDKFVSGRLVSAHVARGVAMREGRLGKRAARLFDPTTCREWLANGGREAIERRVATRRGQGVLPFKKPGA